jgi:hypothetical protein
MNASIGLSLPTPSGQVTAKNANGTEVIKIILLKNKIFSGWTNFIDENGNRDKQNITGKFCFRECTTSQYRTIYHDNQCKACHAWCPTCGGGTSNDCKTCATGYA